MLTADVLALTTRVDKQSSRQHSTRTCLRLGAHLECPAPVVVSVEELGGRFINTSPDLLGIWHLERPIGQLGQR
jgi:hypothetical protein